MLKTSQNWVLFTSILRAWRSQEKRIGSRPEGWERLIYKDQKWLTVKLKKKTRVVNWGICAVSMLTAPKANRWGMFVSDISANVLTLEHLFKQWRPMLVLLMEMDSASDTDIENERTKKTAKRELCNNAELVSPSHLCAYFKRDSELVTHGNKYRCVSHVLKMGSFDKTKD